MGLPAFQERFEFLAAETRSRAQQLTHVAEVHSLEVGVLIGPTNSLVEAINDLRSGLLLGGIELRGLFTEIAPGKAAPGEIVKYASVMASMKRFRRVMAHPYFADVEGNSVIRNAERLESFKTNTAGDGRTTRRLGKRVREAAEGLEKQRQRFVVTVDNLKDRMEGYAAERFDPADLQDALAQAFGKQSIVRFPVVNAYLAR